MIKTYKLFTTPMCHNCPPVKEFMAGQDKVNGSVFDAHLPEGLDEARKYMVTSVPMIIFFDEKGEEVKRAGNAGEAKAVVDSL